MFGISWTVKHALTVMRQRFSIESGQFTESLSFLDRKWRSTAIILLVSLLIPWAVYSKFPFPAP